MQQTYFSHEDGASGWIKYNVTNLKPYNDYKFDVKCRTDKGDGNQVAATAEKTKEHGRI